MGRLAFAITVMIGVDGIIVPFPANKLVGFDLSSCPNDLAKRDTRGTLALHLSILMRRRY